VMAVLKASVSSLTWQLNRQVRPTPKCTHACTQNTPRLLKLIN
jgi:hypothetical protein